ncbi:MAG: histone deacetylase [Flavobacteriales bacterium]
MLKIAWHEEYVFPVPDNHKFPMEKYDLLPKQLLHEGTLEHVNFFQPEVIDKTYISAVHSAEYLTRLYNLKLSPREQRITGFVHNEQLIHREQLIMEGTRRACDYALESGFAANIAGGTHHAYADRGEGFCLLNDHAISAKYLLDSCKVNKVLILDLDVHQGNGTAEIFAENEDVFTFSMHGKDNYPLKKEKSDLDVELELNCDDKHYLKHLDKSLDEILGRFQPEFVLYQSGVDVLKSDKLGKLGLTQDGVKSRDAMVLNFVAGLNVPMVAAMGGGYSKDIKVIVDGHASLFRQIQRDFF